MTEVLLALWKEFGSKVGSRNLLLIVALVCGALYILTMPQDADDEPDQSEVEIDAEHVTAAESDESKEA
jgi:hypothetical protein